MGQEKRESKQISFIDWLSNWLIVPWDRRREERANIFFYRLDV